MKLIFFLVSLSLFSSNIAAQDKYFEKLFYLDFYPTENEDSLFSELNNYILKMTEPLTFFRKNVPLTQTEFEQIRKELKKSAKTLADTNTSYRVYFTTSSGFTNFSIFGFGKNYDQFTFVHGLDTSVKVGIRPVFYLKLKDYERIIPKETYINLKQTLINSFKRAFPTYTYAQNTKERAHLIDSPLDSNAIELLESYFNVISTNYKRNHYQLKLLLEPDDSSKIASNEQIESITNITHKEVLIEEYGEIERSYNSPILPSKVYFSLKFKELAIKKDSKEDYHCLHIGIKVDYIGFSYLKSSVERTLWQKRKDFINEPNNTVLNNLLETYYYYAIWNLIDEKPTNISKQISNFLKTR